MAFGGGGGGQLTPHVHNSVPLQGGPLDFTNNTIASLTAGSTTFSDGAALQELVIGNAGDAMVVNGAGTAPEWGSGGGGSHTFLGSDRVTTARDYMTITINPAVSGSDIGKITACWTYQAVTDPSNWRITVNGITTAGFYNTQRCTLNNGVTGSLDANSYIEGMATASRQCYGIINCQAGTAEATAAPGDTMFAAQGSYASNGSGQYRGGYFTCAADTGIAPHSDTFNSFTEIKIECDGGDFQTGSQFSAWSNDIS
jgi:hypothetical protein